NASLTFPPAPAVRTRVSDEATNPKGKIVAMRECPRGLSARPSITMRRIRQAPRAALVSKVFSVGPALFLIQGTNSVSARRAQWGDQGLVEEHAGIQVLTSRRKGPALAHQARPIPSMELARFPNVRRCRRDTFPFLPPAANSLRGCDRSRWQPLFF